MPLVHSLPPASFWHGRRFRACPFDIDILRAWAKRTARAGHTWWLYRGRLVSPHAVAAFGVQEAWELAGPATIEIDTTVKPWTVGPRA